MFNYKNSLNGIKANLFDIYENQEQIIGLEKDENLRDQRLNRFIEIKDIALMLIDEIESLYINNTNQENFNITKLTNPQIPQVKEESKILNLIQDSNVTKSEVSDDISNGEDDSTEENDIDISNGEDDSTEENDIDISNGEDDSTEENNIDIFNDEDDSTEENDIDISNDEDDSTEEKDYIKKYYLDCDKKRINFAYVPKKIFNKIKKNAKLNDIEQKSVTDVSIENNDDLKLENSKSNDIRESEINYSKFEKIDDKKVKGIIVRSDQYMKLALSKHRQEGVVREAKIYRINEVKKKQRENQKIELEKAKVNIDI